MPVAPRIVNDVSYERRIDHDIPFIAWQAQYLVRLPVAPRIVSDVSYERWINHDIPFAWQAQYLVRLEADSCRFAHCSGCSK